MQGALGQLVDWLALDPATTALLMDFDGTLSEIAGSPELARPMPGVSRMLKTLASLLGVVGVVSGRPLSFLERHLLPSGDLNPEQGGYGSSPGRLVSSSGRLALMGYYGLEGIVDGRRFRDQRGAEWEGVAQAAFEAAVSAAPEAVLVERKPLGVALHWRQAPGSEDSALAAADEVSRRYGLPASRGKMSVELRALPDVNKGSAASRLARECKRVCYLGDDLADLEAFATLDIMGRSGLTSLKVAVGGVELPNEVLARADLHLEGPAAVRDALQHLTAKLDRRRRPAP